MSDSIMCECGKPAEGVGIWNGKDYLDICLDCFNSIEAIATEACVRFAEYHDTASLEECTRIELGFREDIPWTPAIQAEVDKRYCEWYLEYRQEAQ